MKKAKTQVEKLLEENAKLKELLKEAYKRLNDIDGMYAWHEEGLGLWD